MPRSKADITQKKAFVFLPPKVIEKLKKIADEKASTLSGLMRAIIMEYLAKK